MRVLKLTIACILMSSGLVAMADDFMPGVITTIAGNGTQGSSGDGGPAISAQLNEPIGLTVDLAGNLYFINRPSKTVRKVTPEGVISTAVGSEYFPNGFPSDITADVSGNLYITANDTIVLLTSAGAIWSVNTGIFYITAIAADHAGNLYISDWPFFDIPVPIRKGSPGGGFTAVGEVPGEVVWSLAVDSAENVYSAGDSGLWKLEPQGSVTQVQTCPCCVASDIAVDSADNLFVADGDNRVCMVTPEGTVTTIAGNGTIGFSGDGGPALSAQLNHPTSVAVDKLGNILIGDTNNFRVRKVSRAIGSETRFAHIAVGDGYSTTVTLTNTGDTPISGNLILTDPMGQPLTASEASLGEGSSFPVFVAPAGTTSLSIDPVGQNDPLQSGWARVAAAGGVLNGTATFHRMSGGVAQIAGGVLPSPLMRYATIPVDDDLSQGRFTAYAVANPTDRNLLIKLTLVDQDGKVVDESVSFSLGPNQQTARYLYMDMARTQFKGSIVLQAQEGCSFIAMALRQYETLFSVIPVIPGKASCVPD